MLDDLWAGWRSDYLATVSGDPTPIRPDAEGSLFERLLALATTDGDEAALVVHRGASCSVILNAYPYATGHTMVIPNRAVADLGGLGDKEHVELWDLVRATVQAVQVAYDCGGVNVGANLGAAAGAGIPDHLHVHVVPRWRGDTNFMTTVANTRVMPEPLDLTWRRLRDAWPTADVGGYGHTDG